MSKFRPGDIMIFNGNYNSYKYLLLSSTDNYWNVFYIERSSILKIYVDDEDKIYTDIFRENLDEI